MHWQFEILTLLSNSGAYTRITQWQDKTCPSCASHSCLNVRHKPQSNPAFKPMLAQHKSK